MTNREWHETHRLGSGASMDKRIEWHLEHVQNCACRPIPDGVLRAMEKRGVPLPRPDRRYSETPNAL